MRSIVRFADCQAKPSFTRPCLTKALSYFALFLLTLGLPFSLLASQRTHGKQWRSAKVQPETGSGATVVQLSPATVTFPAQAVSTTSNAVTVTLTANNNNGLTIGSISVTGDFAQTNTCGTGWQGGSQPGCAIYVTFKPTATGTRTGTLTVSDNGSTPAQTVTLNGTGWPAGPGATITSLGSLGSAGNYTLAGTVTGMRSKGSPTGSVSFVDASNSKFSLGSNPLSASTVKLGLANGVSAPTSNEAAAVLVGDFNGDGKPDMAVLNSPIGTPCPNTAGSILVFLGKGDGTFTADGSTSVSSCVWGFVAADFNGDGRSDIAFADGKNVTVLFGNADGTFSTKSISMTNAGLAGGDLNGDGKADLVVETTGGIAVLLGQSNETFTTLSVASAPYGDWALIADANGDQKNDLILWDGSNVTVLPGKGDGTFQSPVATSIGNIELGGQSIQPFAVGDFDGDGKLDVVIEGGMSGTNGRHDVFVVFTGKGDGTFTVGTPIQISPSPISSTGSYSSNSGSVTVADFNGDGKDDIAVLNDDVVQVLLSNGDGTFTAAASIDSGAETDPDWLALATGDFNGDGIPDFAAANSDAQSATIALGQRTETAAATLASVSVPGSGAHNIEAVYEGDSNFATSISSPIQLTGSPVATTLILASSTSSTTYGTQVMLTATLAPYSEGGLATNGETVTFLNNGTSIGTGKLSSGVAVLNTTSLPVGTDKLTASYAGDTNFNSAAAQAVSVQVNNPPPPPTGLQFIPVTPCRIADTRNATGPFGGPELATNSTRSFNIPQSACNIPSTAAAYSLNVTVVPGKTLNYLTLWPTGEAQPNVSTLNSFDGRVKANAAIVPAGTSGAVSVYVTDATHVILDIDGYFVPSSSNNSSALAFYPLAPCRIADTRNPSGSLGGPSIAGNTSRAFPVQSSNCNIPSTAKAYSLNVTAIPHKTLNYLTTWPTGQAQPYVSTLNAPTGTVVANAAIVPAGTTGQVSIFVSDTSDVILDINGYFAPPETGGLSLYAVTPCRLIDTRPTAFNATKTVNVEGSACAPPSSAEAYVLNATVVPPGELIYLTLWPAGPTQPYVSTLNALDGAITSNMAIVPTTNGSIDAFSSNPTNLILDISSYFAPPPPSPTITISVSPATVAPGMAATLTWSARNAIACSASGTWSGSQSTAGSLVLSETAVGNYRYSLSCTGNGSPTSGSASLLVTRVKPSSYENKNDMSNAPVSFSDLNLLNAFAVADFFNDGSTSLVLHTLEYNPTNPSTYNNYGHIHFYKQDQKGNWTDQTSTLLANNTGCLHPRKAVVADFNQDGKPDVLFACHGLDVAPYPGEQPHVLLSEPDGTYANVTIPITCYCHGASAADINGDGYPDVLVTDTTVAQTPFFLINHGGTSFQPDYTRLPSSLKGKQIYSAELIDFSGSGYYDVFLGGNEPGTTSYPASEFDPTILPNDGKGDFIITTPVDLLAGNSFGLALDIVYQNGSVYLLKVNNAYTSSEIEKIAYPSFKGVTIYSHSTTYPNGSTWLDWIVPYNGQLVSEDASYQVSVAE